MPRVSVVIPAYNSERFLPTTLESVLASTYRDFEVIVIDDGSTDATAASAAEFAPRVRVLSQPNSGMSAARNNGIAQCDAPLIALLDSDDVWHPEKLRLQVETLESHPDYGVCFTEFRTWDGGDYQSFVSEKRDGSIESSLTGWIYHKMILTNWALPSSVMFRREVWNSLGSFACSNPQTDDWQYFVHASRAFPFVKLKEPLVLYRQLATSLSRKVPAQNSMEMMRDSFIAKFGLMSPDGNQTDLRELAMRRRAGWCNFASTHCHRGDLLVGLKAFSRILHSGPNRRDILQRLVKSIGLRVLRRP